MASFLRSCDRIDFERTAASQSFGYDKTGNRLSDGNGNYSVVPNAHRYSSMRGTTPTYDAAGHLLSDGISGSAGQRYRYNQAGQLDQVSEGSGSGTGAVLANYYYDHQGRRSRKVTMAAAPQGAGTTVYHYDQHHQLLAETTATGLPLKTYVWRDGAAVALIDHANAATGLASERLTYLIQDDLGSPRSGQDSSRREVWRWDSAAFGGTPPNEDVDGDGSRIELNLRFAGQYFDRESGLHYNHFRYYDPKAGRYTQSDPIGLEGGINTYGYVEGNPLSYVDPMGLQRGPAMRGVFYPRIPMPSGPPSPSINADAKNLLDGMGNNLPSPPSFGNPGPNDLLSGEPGINFPTTIPNLIKVCDLFMETPDDLNSGSACRPSKPNGPSLTPAGSSSRPGTCVRWRYAYRPY